jgi:hypothetical protein
MTSSRSTVLCRCRNPWHDDPDSPEDWTAYIGYDEEGFPYVFDEVDQTRHVLPESTKRQLRKAARKAQLR